MINKLIELGLEHNIDIEVFTNTNEAKNIEILNDKLINYQLDYSKDYKIKAIKDNMAININLETISNPNNIIKEIENIFSLVDNKNTNILCDTILKTKKTKLDLLNNDDQVKKDLLSLNDLKKDNKLIKDLQISYSENVDIMQLKNKNTELNDSKKYYCYCIAITIGNEVDTKIAYVTHYSTKYEFDKFYELSKSKVNDITKKLNSESVLTNKYNVILKNNVINSILSQFTSMFFSKSIDLKKSLLTDKLNEKVFSDKITIIEDPTNKELIGKRLFDDEGIKTYKKEIISEGIFRIKLNNREYSIKNNEIPTGNSYGVRNLYIKPENNTFNELVNNLKDGIYIDEVYGTHSGINVNTGEISLQAEGFLIKNGIIENGLNMIILTTNIFELLNNVELIGNDLKFFGSSNGCPSILVKDITITGKK